MGKHSSSNEILNTGELKKEILVIDSENENVYVDEDLKNLDSQRRGRDKDLSESLISSQIVNECQSKMIDPEGRNGFLVAKIPVVISEFEIEINCETVIKLDQPAVEIKRVKKNVYLTQCKLLPLFRKLFISGFVRKNLEYAAARSKESRGGNNIRHFTMDVPFICTTMIDYFIPPVISASRGNDEIQVYDAGSDILEHNFQSMECLNEKIYCELSKAQIMEMDLIEEDRNSERTKYGGERSFQSLTEKMVLNLRLKLLQNQEVNIYPQKAPAPSSGSKKKSTKAKQKNPAEEQKLIEVL